MRYSLPGRDHVDGEEDGDYAMYICCRSLDIVLQLLRVDMGTNLAIEREAAL